MKDVSHVLLRVQDWTVWSYCFYLGVGWAGLSKAAAEFVSCPHPAHNSKILWVQLDSHFSPPIFFSFPQLHKTTVEIVYVFCQIQSFSQKIILELGLVQFPEIVEAV